MPAAVPAGFFFYRTAMDLDFTKFDGLLPAVIQDHKSGEVLMVGFMNEEAWKKTVETGFATFYSRSRKKLWLKGESSGHTQRVVEMRLDCDQDAVWIKVEQAGAACHTGRRSCFYRAVTGEDGETKLSFVDADKLFDPAKVYR